MLVDKSAMLSPLGFVSIIEKLIFLCLFFFFGLFDIDLVVIDLDLDDLSDVRSINSKFFPLEI